MDWGEEGEGGDEGKGAAESGKAEGHHHLKMSDLLGGNMTLRGKKKGNRKGVKEWVEEGERKERSKLRDGQEDEEWAGGERKRMDRSKTVGEADMSSILRGMEGERDRDRLSGGVRGDRDRLSGGVREEGGVEQGEERKRRRTIGREEEGGIGGEEEEEEEEEGGEGKKKRKKRKNYTMRFPLKRKHHDD